MSGSREGAVDPHTADKKSNSQQPTGPSLDPTDVGEQQYVYLDPMYSLKLAAQHLMVPLSSLKWILYWHAAEFPRRYNLYARDSGGGHMRMLTLRELRRVREIAFVDRKRARRYPMRKVTKEFGVVVGERTTKGGNPTEGTPTPVKWWK